MQVGVTLLKVKEPIAEEYARLRKDQVLLRQCTTDRVDPGGQR